VVSSALSDEALLAGLAAGDADAATAFIRRFQARVYGLVVTIVRDEGVAEDVAQETFVRAWKHARTYDPRRGRVATWLLTIARNLAIAGTRWRCVHRRHRRQRQGPRRVCGPARRGGFARPI
jgi:RNA polymerase sigma-70 factor (ECF subfamily)